MEPKGEKDNTSNAIPGGMRGEKGESDLVKLAKRSIEAIVREGRLLSRSDCPELVEKIKGSAGAFVSIKKRGQLRGCIGTFRPTRKDLADEIIYNAVSACQHDPRFPPVREDELEELEITVDVLEEPEPVPGPEFLDPKEYGVIVKSGPKTGLLLPDLEGVDTVEEQIDIARRKAGIMPGEPLQLFRFRVSRHK